MIHEENMKLIVEVIFKKAQNEKDYCSFYGELVEKLIKLELQLKGQLKPGKRVTKKIQKESDFRK